MPGLVKIGQTSTSVEQRMRELDTTGVPIPYQCFYAAKVVNVDLVEKKIHYAFGEQRLRKNREFFKIDPNRVKAVIELIAIEEVTPQVNNSLIVDDHQAISEYNDRRTPFRFSLANVPLGENLNLFEMKVNSAVLSTIDPSNITGRLRALALQHRNYSKNWVGNRLKSLDLYIGLLKVRLLMNVVRDLRPLTKKFESILI